MGKYFIYDEVVIHNKDNDFWVVVHNNVINLTPLLEDRRDSWNANLEFLRGFGGKDLSAYFCKDGAPRVETSNQTGRKRVIFPPIVEFAMSDMLKTPRTIWSQDEMYKIGEITQQERGIRLINTLTRTTYHMTVCEEDTINDILEKYQKTYNFHAASYIWRKQPANGKGSGRLFFNKTLTENGIHPSKDGIDPAIWLYYSDDLTIA